MLGGEEEEPLFSSSCRSIPEEELHHDRHYYLYFLPVLRIRIRDPVPFSPLDPESGMNNPEHIFYSLETIFLGLKYIKYLNSFMRIQDPRW